MTQSVAVDAWGPTGPLPTADGGFEMGGDMAPLPDGRALLAGGAAGHGDAIAAAALFDPKALTWSATASMGTSRRLHSVTRLLPDGTVLAAGGITGPYSNPPQILSSAELFDPAKGTWSPTGSMGGTRFGHSATLLGDGRVLAAGGAMQRDSTTTRVLNSCELYDPATRTWRPTAPMVDARYSTWGATVLLADGRVLAIGGGVELGETYSAPLAFCEIFDPRAETWTPTGSLSIPRWLHTATALPDGSVLVAGGATDAVSLGPIVDRHSHATTERWDPSTGRWSAAAPMPFGRSRHQALLLNSGRVLVFGGGDEANLFSAYPSTLTYDPQADAWAAAGPLSVGRFDCAAVILADGRVLTAGGDVVFGVDNAATATSELFTPRPDIL